MYVEKENIGLWFSEEIARKSCTHNSARRNVSALQYFADNLEHVGEGFVVVSNEVESALKQVGINRNTRNMEEEGKIDEDNLPNPYGDLPTNNISSQDIEKIMRHVLMNRNDWADVGICLLWGVSAFLRGDSVRKSTICDIFLDYNHGAEKRGEFCTSISWVIRKGGQNNKVKFPVNHVVGCWRHKEYLQCPIGILAMSFLHRLGGQSELGSKLSFVRRNHKKDFFWRNINLVSYEVYDDEYQVILLRSIYSNEFSAVNTIFYRILLYPKYNEITT